MKRANLGSVSTGTLRPEDLIPAFVSELEQQKPCHRKHRALIREVNTYLNLEECGSCGAYHPEGFAGDCRENQKRFANDEDFFQSETASELLNELMDALNEYAPAYFYFGAHPGDGADFGFWLSENMPEDFDGLKVSDLSEVPTGYSGEVLHVNDHGNMTLYAYSRGRRREVWGIV